MLLFEALQQRPLLIDLIHDNRHDDFDIIIQISHIVCQGVNIEMFWFFFLMF